MSDVIVVNSLSREKMHLVWSSCIAFGIGDTTRVGCGKPPSVCSFCHIGSKWVRLCGFASALVATAAQRARKLFVVKEGCTMTRSGRQVYRSDESKRMMLVR